MKRITVFAGSRPTAEASFLRAGRALGKEIASRGIELVYGGGRAGVMGALADSVLASGGRVIGVIPDFMFEKELAHPDLAELHVVGSMHDRKALLMELGDAFIALPGAFGTLEEIFEALTGAELGLHDKPCALLDVGGYFDSLVRFLDEAVARGLLKKEHRSLIIVGTRAPGLLDRLESARSSSPRKGRNQSRRAAPGTEKQVTVYERIYEVVRRVPRGRVATYGEIAARAGIPNPRQIGYALHALRDDAGVPWHRVINAKGEVSLRSEPGCDVSQRRLLEAEGVRFDERGRVSLDRFGWRPRGSGARGARRNKR